MDFLQLCGHVRVQSAAPPVGFLLLWFVQKMTNVPRVCKAPYLVASASVALVHSERAVMLYLAAPRIPKARFRLPKWSMLYRIAMTLFLLSKNMTLSSTYLSL